MTPTEAAAKLRQLAEEMRELSEWKGVPQVDKDYGRRSFDLLTAAWVMSVWASRLEAAINNQGQPQT
jgi:hypothetical protein